MDSAASDHLQGIVASADLLADLAGADVVLLVPSPEAGRLQVAAHGRPTVVRSLYARAQTGESLPERAEPLVARCLRRGREQRSRYAVVMAGRPVEQTVLPVRRGARGVAGALSVERSLLNGAWLPGCRPLRAAAEGLAGNLLQGALESRHALSLLRMGRGIAVTGPSGEMLYADAAARQAWNRALGTGEPLTRLPEGAPAGAAILSQRTSDWGQEWEFDIAGTVFRRRDVALGPDGARGALSTIADVTHLHSGKWMVSGRSAALQEIHHRVKNNLQTISSLLRMQVRRETSEAARASLRTAVGRVQSVAFVHEALSLDGAEEIDLNALASTLADAALHDDQRLRGRIAATVVGPRLLIPAARATQVALVLNEAVQNAVKHAFPGDREGTLTIRFERDASEITIVVQDDGIGLPEGFSLAATRSLGLQIAQTIVESDLGGSLRVAGGEGVSVTMRLPGTVVHQETDGP